MANEDAQKLMDVLHSRLNHLQVLLAALYGLVISVAGGIGTAVLLYSLKDGMKPDEIMAAAEPFAIAGWFALLWACVFTSYQIYATVLCVRSLSKIEDVLAVGVTGHKKYFNDTVLRLAAYAVAHAFPVFAFVFSPALMCHVHAIDADKAWLLGTIGIAVMTVSAVPCVIAILKKPKS